MNTTSNYTSISRLALAERILDKRHMLDVVSSMPWNRDKAAIVSRVVDELYQLSVQLQNMR